MSVKPAGLNMLAVRKSLKMYCWLLVVMILDVTADSTENDKGADAPFNALPPNNHDDASIKKQDEWIPRMSQQAFISSPFPEQRMPNGNFPNELSLMPQPMIFPGQHSGMLGTGGNVNAPLMERERLDSLLKSEFGPASLEFQDELRYRFARNAISGLTSRRITIAIASPKIPPGFRNELEIEDHIRGALQEGQLEGQMLARVDDLALKYMDDVISNFELQRGDADIERKKEAFVNTLNREFGRIDTMFQNRMWYHYRMPIYTQQRALGLPGSFSEPILPAGFNDEMEFQTYIISIQRDEGIKSRIAERTEELAKAYLDGFIASKSTSRAGSCEGRCYDKYDSTHVGCHCNKECSTHGDCCPDFDEVCGKTRLCERRCFTQFNRFLPCQCNSECIERKDCCSDFQSSCLSDVEAAENVKIGSLMHHNKVFKRLVDKFHSEAAAGGHYLLERKYYPQCSAYGTDVCEDDKLDYILRDDLVKLKNMLKLIWMRLTVASNDDLLVSSDAKNDINQAWVDGWGPESYSIVHNAIEAAAANHLKTTFYHNGEFYGVMDMFRNILCTYRQCNVGICRLAGMDHSTARKERAGILLKEKWSMQEFSIIDPKVRYRDAGISSDFTDPNQYLFDIWTVYLCSIEDLYGATEFLLQYPTQKSLGFVLQRFSYCKCTDNFTGPYCNDCP